MAEAIGIAAGVIGIVDHAARVSTFLSDLVVSKKGAIWRTVKLEIEIYTTILREVGQIALSGTSALPQSASLSLQLCELYLSKLQDKIPRVLDSETNSARKIFAKHASDEMMSDLKDYRRSVKILRDVVME
jgi:hypothetical protein